MYITSMRIQNYRNFKDITMAFHPLANYLVGENDIGKAASCGSFLYGQCLDPAGNRLL